MNLHFDVVRSEYSKGAFLASTSLQIRESPLTHPSTHSSALSLLTVLFHPCDYDILSPRLKQQSVRGSLSFEVSVSKLRFCPGPEH